MGVKNGHKLKITEEEAANPLNDCQPSQPDCRCICNTSGNIEGNYMFPGPVVDIFDQVSRKNGQKRMQTDYSETSKYEKNVSEKGGGSSCNCSCGGIREFSHAHSKSIEQDKTISNLKNCTARGNSNGCKCSCQAGGGGGTKEAGGGGWCNCECSSGREEFEKRNNRSDEL